VFLDHFSQQASDYARYRLLYPAKLSEFWPPQIHWVDEHFQTLPFPFNEIATPEFAAEAMWLLHDLFGYLSSWSAAQR
jgi:hypothetical protein